MNDVKSRIQDAVKMGIDELDALSRRRVTIDGLMSLRHCVGMSQITPRRGWGYRNHLTYKKIDKDMEEMVRAGLMVKMYYVNRDNPEEFRVVYSATRAGMELVGLPKARIKELTSELKDLLETHHEEAAE